jgi:hypothetical protein
MPAISCPARAFHRTRRWLALFVRR